MQEAKQDRISEQEAKIILEAQTGIEFDYIKALYNEDKKRFSFEVKMPDTENTRQLESLDNIDSNFPMVSVPEDFEPYRTLADYLEIPFFGVFDYIFFGYGNDWEPGAGRGENIYCWTDKKGWLEIAEIESAFLAEFGNLRKNSSMKDEKWTVKIFGNCCHGISYKKNPNDEWPTKDECELPFDDLKDKLIQPGGKFPPKKHPIDRHNKTDADKKIVITEKEKTDLEKAAAEARETTGKVMAEAAAFADKAKEQKQQLEQELARKEADVQKLIQEKDRIKKLLEQERTKAIELTQELEQELAQGKARTQELTQEKSKVKKLESVLAVIKRKKKAKATGFLIILALMAGIIFYAVNYTDFVSSIANRISAMFPQPQPQSQPQPEMFTDRYVHMGLNLREGPSADSGIITTLEQNTIVRVSDEGRSGVWVKTNSGDYTGFVNEQYLRDFYITEILVGDQLSSGEWAVPPGSVLTGRSIRHLGILVNVATLNSYNEMTSFRVKIIDPNGNLRNNPVSSPPGYTREKSIMINNDGSYDLVGWGADISGSYYSGSWKIEIWYEHPRNPETNALIASGSFQFQ